MTYFRFSAVLAAVFGILCCLLIVGLLMWNVTLAHKLGEDRSSLRCVRKVTLRDPVTDAAADFRRGETRFYFSSHDGYVPSFTADGLSPECSGDFNNPSLHRDPFPALGNRIIPETDGPDKDPDPNTCGMVIDAYIRRYNEAMARLSPRSIRSYCQ